MSDIKIWHRICIVCKHDDVVQYTQLPTPPPENDNRENDKGENDEDVAVVHTNCPDPSLNDTNAAYQCRSCRSAMALEGHKLQLKMMDERSQEKKELQIQTVDKQKQETR
ncbi:uncharacterized protein B0J16DRAFT_380073 [Fusarium flagelliforme]|uniref:uncharacterized protein n=1 Tax=Fusarium flagelliforme TaxID=2675880 RepID=UPI001E8D8803|nr:uncharacterized protein B0J16DRAFT_380073 [Fusarium flagelliforme]KAH7192189.1 hypothetical protein B0J16DRAFT_380073 [Fusarium flagelliforme]